MPWQAGFKFSGADIWMQTHEITTSELKIRMWKEDNSSYVFSNQVVWSIDSQSRKFFPTMDPAWAWDMFRSCRRHRVNICFYLTENRQSPALAKYLHLFTVYMAISPMELWSCNCITIRNTATGIPNLLWAVHSMLQVVKDAGSFMSAYHPFFKAVSRPGPLSLSSSFILFRGSAPNIS